MSVRLYAILARESNRAVVFRRGPSKQVLLISWNTDTDTFTEGQWLKGRIYERRCDLSPDGEFLVYFAASYRKPYFSWTAVSRPPFLTALALWPKGDCWGGGGHFERRDVLALNHQVITLADDFALPKWMQVKRLGSRPGWGEDDPIWSMRLEREGWIRTSGGAMAQRGDPKQWITFDPPIHWHGRDPLLLTRAGPCTSTTLLPDQGVSCVLGASFPAVSSFPRFHQGPLWPVAHSPGPYSRSYLM